MATTTSKSTAGRVTIKLDDRDIQSILRAFSKMDKQANKDLRDLSKNIASDLVTEFRNASRGTPWYPKQASLVAQSAKVARDRVPAVTLGGTKRFSTSSGRQVAAGSLLFLSEFGSPVDAQRARFRGGLQGPPRSPKEGRGNRGWWLFPRLKRLQPDILRRWIEGAQKVADTWGNP